MSKTIRVTDEVHALILKYQGVRETISQTIERAFAGFEVLDSIKRGDFTLGLPQKGEKTEGTK